MSRAPQAPAARGAWYDLHAMNTEMRLHRLQSRQGAGERRQPDPSIGRMLESMERSISKIDARLSACINAWRAALPEEIVAQTRLKTYSRGVLTVIVENPGVAYELDRCLRGGAQKAIREQVPFTLTRIRTEVGRLTLPIATAVLVDCHREAR